MSTLPLWVVILVGVSVGKLALDICEHIIIFILRWRQQWPTGAENYSNSPFDHPPPSYAEACRSSTLNDTSPCTEASPSEASHTEACESPVLHDVSRVQKLQSFFAWRLAIEYHLDSRSPSRDRDQEYFLGLCKKYCMLLGMQFKSSKEVATAKEKLTRDVFEPARMLGIPAGKSTYFFLLWHMNKDIKADLNAYCRCHGSVSLFYTLLCAQ